MFVLCTYDVDAKRTVIFRKILRKYLGHEQNSVFYGRLSESKRVEMRKEVVSSIEEGDKILEISAPNANNVHIESLVKSADTSRLSSLKDRRHTQKSIVI